MFNFGCFNVQGNYFGLMSLNFSSSNSFYWKFYFLKSKQFCGKSLKAIFRLMINECEEESILFSFSLINLETRFWCLTFLMISAFIFLLEDEEFVVTETQFSFCCPGVRHNIKDGNLRATLCCWLWPLDERVQLKGILVLV